jgi:hypothetical protein
MKMQTALDNTSVASAKYAERSRPEIGEPHASNQADHRTQTDRRTGADLESKVHTPSILATAGSAAGGAFLVGSFAGPIGALGGALIGIGLGLYLQKSNKK